jgi:hypothetical protein
MRIERILCGGLALLGTIAAERPARACGGCFHPVGETPTVVTDHRMIVSISKTQSTLYDQIKYTGAPGSFAWVLPISGTVTVGLSSDRLFAAIDSPTQTQLLPPPANCPAPPSCGGYSSSGGSGASASFGGAGGVTVVSKEVVGPFETVQLSATTPNALETWLADNGFNIPSDVAPIIDTYQTEHFNFLALKLAPGKGVQDMRPVRVTTLGSTIALPLRMVAAGTGATVGITLWVIGEGRYEPQNFPSFALTANDVSWDWAKARSDYTDLRAAKTAAANGRIWEIESSMALSKVPIQQTVTVDNTAGYLPVKDASGAVTKTELEARDEDLATLLSGIAPADGRVTRLRADLAHAALDTDLLMQAASDQSELSNVRQLTKQIGQPSCPSYGPCMPTPGDQPPGSGTADTFRCGAGPRGDTDVGGWAGLGIGAIAAAHLIRRRRRS